MHTTSVLPISGRKITLDGIYLEDSKYNYINDGIFSFECIPFFEYLFFSLLFIYIVKKNMKKNSEDEISKSIKLINRKKLFLFI